jgi:hypothetical protein
MTKIILVSGLYGAGKSTLVDFIILKLLNFEIRKYSFATPVKQIATDVYGWDGKKDEKGRRLLQEIGQTGRDYNLDIWLRKFEDYVETKQRFSSNPANFWIVDDWRYRNERENIQITPQANVFTIRAVRDIERDVNVLSHPSECGLPHESSGYYEWVFDNNVDNLENNVEAHHLVSIISTFLKGGL